MEQIGTFINDDENEETLSDEDSDLEDTDIF